MTDLLLGFGVLLFGAAVALVVFLAREQRIPTTVVRGLALLCGAGLLSMLLTDWPSEVLARFWADHSVVAGILSTILLVGVVFLAFEDSERRRQDELDGSVTAAGLGGLVDHVVDAEIALALLSREGPPVEWDWDAEGKPLRWMRRLREGCSRRPDGSPDPASDPRALPAHVSGDAEASWRVELVDQVVRRLLAGIRDWSPVVRGSRNGTMVLIAIGHVRNDLMELGSGLRSGRCDVAMLVLLRQRLRLLACFMDRASGADPLRGEVLTSMDPLPLWSDDLDWAADPAGRSTFGKAWRDQLSETMRVMNRHA